MGSALDFIFGGPDDSAQKAQISENAKFFDFIQSQGLKAETDVKALAPAASEARTLGFQGAFDVLGQAFPQQQQVFQQGNVGAQRQLLAGLPQQQAALLGQPTSFGGLQPIQLGIDTRFTQQTVPTFQGSTAALQAGQPARPAALDPSAFTPEQLAALAAQLQAGGFFSQGGASNIALRDAKGGGGGIGGNARDSGGGGPAGSGGMSGV